MKLSGTESASAKVSASLSSNAWFLDVEYLVGDLLDTFADSSDPELSDQLSDVNLSLVFFFDRQLCLDFVVAA